MLVGWKATMWLSYFKIIIHLYFYIFHSISNWIIFAVNLRIVKLYVIFQTDNSKSHAFYLQQRVSALSLNHFYSIYYVSVLLSSLTTAIKYCCIRYSACCDAYVLIISMPGIGRLVALCYSAIIVIKIIIILIIINIITSIIIIIIIAILSSSSSSSWTSSNHTVSIFQRWWKYQRFVLLFLSCSTS